MMKSFYKLAGGTALFALSTLSMPASANYIDLFSFPATGQVVTTDGPQDASQVGPDATTILGGYRDLTVVNSTPNGDNDGICETGEGCSTLTQFGGTLTFDNDTSATGFASVQWDGDDTATGIENFDITGLGGLDLVNQEGCPAGGCDRFFLDVLAADLGFNFEFQLYTDATHFTEVNITSAGPGHFEVLFADLQNAALCGTSFGAINFVNCGGGGNNQTVDMTSVGGFQILLNTLNPGTTSVDLQIGAITKGVPEPASLALMGIGLAGFGLVRRRKPGKA